jgi:cobyrinic acid a,c-diamide synthase
MGRPRIMIAGAQSGTGKTTVSAALAIALGRRGMKVATFKAGPDFLDPTYLGRASGRPCYNLDTWMMGVEYTRSLLERKSRDADISLVEGVMGLFDGAAPDSLEGSSAEIAAITGTPVLLLVNVHGMSRSIAALVKGYSEFVPGVRIEGVIANNVGSAGHGEALAKALRASGLPELLGAVPRGGFPPLSSRHLGLVTANTEILGETTLDALADAIERHVDVEAIAALAGKAGDLKDEERTREEPRSRKPLKLALAFDEAFHFYYQDTLDAFEEAGFELARFSPIRDRGVPAGTGGLFLGGGYPEVFAADLAGNGEMLASIREAARSGMPVYAECGGLMYLSEEITDSDGKAHRMCGVLPLRTRMLEKRKALGYVEVELAADSLWGEKGATARGHEFHYSELNGDRGGADPAVERVYRVKLRRTGAVDAEGFQKGNVLASYAHLHLASRPETVRRFYRKCAEFVGR